MSNELLMQALKKAANQDLAIARKNGILAIAQTKLGTLEVKYANRLYTVMSQDGQVLCWGNASKARELLMSVYDVVMQ
jgi:hypothetical protein